MRYSIVIIRNKTDNVHTGTLSFLTNQLQSFMIHKFFFFFYQIFFHSVCQVPILGIKICK